MKVHIFRKSESSRAPKLVEYLQNGILIRFNIQEVMRDDVLVMEYDEFWFDLKEPNIEDIVNDGGFALSNDHKTLLK